MVTGGRAIAAIRHFTRYTVLEWNRVVPGLDCNLPPACGGELSGVEYDLNETCFNGTPPENGELSFCQGTSFTQGLMLSSGVLAFGVENDVFRATTVAAFTRLILQPPCLTTVGTTLGTTISACEPLEGAFAALVGLPLTCSGNPVQSCTCYAPTEQMVESIASGTYATQNNTLTITTSQGSSTLDYCVDGTNLYATDGGEFDWVYLE